MKTVVVVQFIGGDIEVYSTLSTFIKNNKQFKLKGQSIRNRMYENNGIYSHPEFALKRYEVKR
jgi:hypothetical protein